MCRYQHSITLRASHRVDLFASLAQLTGQPIPENSATDSHNSLETWLGRSDKDRDFVVQLSVTGTLSIVDKNLKYITPSRAEKISRHTGIELGNDTIPQLYDLANDAGEKNNIAAENPGKVKELEAELKAIR